MIQNKDNKNEKKKKHKGLKILLFVVLPLLIVFIGGPVIFFYGFIYDNSSSGFVPDENFDASREVQALGVRSLDYSQDTGKISVNLTKNAVNNILYEQVTSKVEKSLEDVNLEIKDNQYILSAKVAASSIIATRVYITFEVEKIASETDTFITLLMKDIKIGRLGGLTNVAFSLFGSSLNDETIVNLFKSLGITVSSDMANRKVTISQSTLVADIKARLASGEDDNMFMAIIDSLNEANLVGISHNDDTALAVDIDLSSLKENLTYQNTTKDENDYPNTFAKGAIRTLLNNNVVDADHADDVFKYLYYGYPRVSTTIQNYVQDLDLSSVEIADPTTYIGYSDQLASTTTADEAVKNSANPAEIALTGNIATISEAIFDDSLLGEDLIGYSLALKGQDTDAYKYNPITIQNFYTVIKDDELDLVCNVDINGYSTNIIIHTEASETEADYCLSLAIKDVYYGTVKANDTLIDALFDLINNNTETSWLTLDKSGRKFTLDFSSAIESVSGASEAIAARGGANLSLRAGTNPGEGYLLIETNS